MPFHSIPDVYKRQVLNLESAEKTYQSGISSHDLDIQAQIKNIELLSLQISDIEKKLIKVKNLEKAPISGYVTEIYVTEGDVYKRQNAKISRIK